VNRGPVAGRLGDLFRYVRADVADRVIWPMLRRALVDAGRRHLELDADLAEVIAAFTPAGAQPPQPAAIAELGRCGCPDSRCGCGSRKPLRVGDVARLVDCSTQNVRQAASRGTLRGVRDARGWVFQSADVETWRRRCGSPGRDPAGQRPQAEDAA